MPSDGEDNQLPSAKHSCENFLLSFSPPISHLDLKYCRPKFSIRDYVGSMRSKSIKNNWPFSSKALQLCVNHGVKDVLPDFHYIAGGSLKKHLIDGCADASSCKYMDENEDLFSANEASQRMTESPPNLKESHSIAKKRRIIVKISGKLGCNAAEESAWGSDSMASKVCPVCKAFSSSSNTTLNAHIDQCLSAQAAPLAADGCKHHREKRKKRLMTDVYATAKHCTVEDLELRNGIRRLATSTSNEDESNGDKLKTLSEEKDLRFPTFVLGNNSKGRRSSRPHNKTPKDDTYPHVDFEADHEKTQRNGRKHRSKLHRSSRAIVDKARRFSSFRRRILADAKTKENKQEETFSDKRITGGDFSTFSTLQYDSVAPELDMPSGFCRAGNFTEEFCTGTFEESSFPTVDPISIPGPPGSYLPPSPEDFQVGNSRVQSSIDMPEVLDGDSSDSPISAASTISNSLLIPASLTLHTVSAPRSKPAKERSEMDYLQVKNDQHCCCQRKEMYINYENLESVRRRSMDSAGENQANWRGFSSRDPAGASSNPILRLMGKNLMVMNTGNEPTVPARAHPHRNAPGAIGESSVYGRRETLDGSPLAGSSSYAPGLPRSHHVAGEAPRGTNLNVETRSSEFSRYGSEMGSSVYPFRAPMFYYHPAFGINFLDQHPPHK